MLGRRNDGTALEGEYLTGRTTPKERLRKVRHLALTGGKNLPNTIRQQLALLMKDVPQSKVIDNAPWFLEKNSPISILWDTKKADDWLEALAEAEHVAECLIVTEEKKLFSTLKTRVLETLGPIQFEEEEKRPLAEGFLANLEYFKLDFLDPWEIQAGQQFDAILPILWMMAGAKGKRPKPPKANMPWLIPDDCPFAVLLQETRFREFRRCLEARPDLTHVFLVTNSQDTFFDLKEEISVPHVIQLYKAYLDNFKINMLKGAA